MHRILLIALLCCIQTAQSSEPTLDAPEVALTGLPLHVAVPERVVVDSPGPLSLRVEGKLYQSVDGTFADVILSQTGITDLAVVDANDTLVFEKAVRVIPAWACILPPLVAIFLALLFRSVVPALFAGLWVGAWAITGFSPIGLFTGLLDAFQVYVANAVADADHAAIMLFTFMVGGMVGIISRNGGMQAVVNLIVRWADNARRGQIATIVLGLAIFFDDYANTLVVGNTARPVTDRLRISREKLAYLVDSTAAPVATVALVTTWIGYEVGLIADAVEKIDGIDESAYSIFLNSIAYSFYPLLAILFVFLVAWTGRDFGPMYKAELRARTRGELLGPDAQVDPEALKGEALKPREGRPQRAINAVLPVVVLIVGVGAGLWHTGEGEGLREIIASADAYKALMWASLLAAMTGIALSMGQGILTLGETMDAWYAGLKFMLLAMIILVLAWALSAVTDVLHTADYIVSALGDNLPVASVPAIVFVLAALIAFATGTSWGVMAILMPLAIPLGWAVMQSNGLVGPEHLHILYSTVACVLAGAVWGDHCSPISDTTVLSSLASACDHIDHVRTQLPYALLVGSVALLLGTVPSGFGVPAWLSYLVAGTVLIGGLLYFGRQADAAEPVADIA